jgi:hypothetical protein
MYPGEAVLLHGTLPPIHLDAVRWWREKDLRGLVPLDTAGNPNPPPDLPTCPLTDEAAADLKPAIDPATLHAALAQLPAPRDMVAPTHGADHGMVTEAIRDPPAKRPAAPGNNRIVAPAGRCELCGQQLAQGEGDYDRRGDRRILRCAPSCVDRRQLRRREPVEL